MGLRIKNKRKFILANVIVIFLLICTVVGFFTIVGKIVGFFKGGEDAPQPTPSAAATSVQPAGASGNDDQKQDQKDQKDQKGEEGTVDASTLNSNLVLVNKTHTLSSDYEPGDLVTVSGTTGLRGTRDTQMRKEAAEALTKLFEAADADGITLYCTSGYRSYALQEEVYQENIAMEGSESAANQLSAKPGQSEHQTGLVMDVTSESVDMELVEAFADTEEGQWVKDHSHEYGFIIRFPKGKEEITGYAYEPWHLRYVGTEAAAAMYESGQTLEEYLGQN
ncbi:MAG: M15 family metallopeptidase [Eubacterium sp.]|nr:M15 family metallopeptidase [Eubacterium sp.]